MTPQCEPGTLMNSSTAALAQTYNTGTGLGDELSCIIKDDEVIVVLLTLCRTRVALISRGVSCHADEKLIVETLMLCDELHTG